MLILSLVGCADPSGVEIGVVPSADSDPADSVIPRDTDSAPPAVVWPALLVNELMADNRRTVEDPVGGRSDWIELHNPTGETVDLDGWTLSDQLDPSDDAHPLDALSVPAGGYLLLWADNEPDLGPDHLSFSLDTAGEAVALYAPGPTAIDGLRFGALAADVSLARQADGAWALSLTPTPGAANTANAARRGAP